MFKRSNIGKMNKTSSYSEIESGSDIDSDQKSIGNHVEGIKKTLENLPHSSDLLEKGRGIGIVEHRERQFSETHNLSEYSTDPYRTIRAIQAQEIQPIYPLDKAATYPDKLKELFSNTPLDTNTYLKVIQLCYTCLNFLYLLKRENEWYFLCKRNSEEDILSYMISENSNKATNLEDYQWILTKDSESKFTSDNLNQILQDFCKFQKYLDEKIKLEFDKYDKSPINIHDMKIIFSTIIAVSKSVLITKYLTKLYLQTYPDVSNDGILSMAHWHSLAELLQNPMVYLHVSKNNGLDTANYYNPRRYAPRSSLKFNINDNDFHKFKNALPTVIEDKKTNVLHRSAKSKKTAKSSDSMETYLPETKYLHYKSAIFQDIHVYFKDDTSQKELDDKIQQYILRFCNSYMSKELSRALPLKVQHQNTTKLDRIWISGSGIKKGDLKRVFLNVVTSEMFHDALHYAYDVTFTNIYPDDIRMFLSLPVRVGGFFDLIDRKSRPVFREVEVQCGINCNKKSKNAKTGFACFHFFCNLWNSTG